MLLDADAPTAPVALASDDELAQALEIILAGFGFNDPNAPVGFGTLRKVRVAPGPIEVAADPASAALEQRFGYHAATEFVAGRKGLGRDTCNGDSGGPAYISIAGVTKLCGLTSRATREAAVNCGDGGIYVRPWRYRDWLAEVLAPFGVVL